MEADPTKFSTTEQFIEAVEGEKSLPEFTKQRSESILKQLSGELVVEATTQENMAMPNPNEMGDMNIPMQRPDDFDQNQMPEDFDPSQAPPFNQNGDNQGERPNGVGQIQRPDKNGGPMWPNQGGEQLNQGTVIDKNTVLTAIVCFALLIVELLFVLKFNRRGR